MIVDIYNQKNEKIREVDLPDKIFKQKWNADLVHQAVSAQLANARQILAHAKGRGEVRGGGKKPWRQKGTGRARHGSIRSPLWKGGGVTFGPSKERNFSKKINKKMKRLAIFSVLSKKLKDGYLKVVDKFEIESLKTKDLAAVLSNLFGSRPNALLIAGSDGAKISRTASNLLNVGAISSKSLNVYDLMKHKNIILEKKAVEEIKKHYKV